MILVSSSSCISRLSASCGVSPGSIFPPGNSQFPAAFHISVPSLGSQKYFFSLFIDSFYNRHHYTYRLHIVPLFIHKILINIFSHRMTHLKLKIHNGKKSSFVIIHCTLCNILFFVILHYIFEFQVLLYLSFAGFWDTNSRQASSLSVISPLYSLSIIFKK